VKIASDRMASVLGLEGVIVTDVLPDSGAAAAGLRPPEKLTVDEFRGDLIVGVDGRRVRGSRDLFMVLDELKPGQKVEVAILRDGRPRVLEVTLQALE
jgi:S1-C subfamily serine protease